MLLFLMQCAPSSVAPTNIISTTRVQIVGFFYIWDDFFDVKDRTRVKLCFEDKYFFFINDIHGRFFPQLLLIIEHNFSAFRKHAEP